MFTQSRVAQTQSTEATLLIDGSRWPTRFLREGSFFTLHLGAASCCATVTILAHSVLSLSYCSLVTTGLGLVGPCKEKEDGLALDYHLDADSQTQSHVSHSIAAKLYGSCDE